MKRFITDHISDIIYGANDGIITTFAIVASAAGANLGNSTIVILGIANLLADGFSMGSSSYLSQRSEYDVAVANGNNTMDDESLKGGVVTFVSFIIVGSIPLIPFFIPFITNPFMVSMIMTFVTFFIVGGLRAFVTKRSFLGSGLEMLLVGGVAAAIAYGVGWLVESLI